MRAIVITKPGGPEVLEVRDVPRPEPRGEQVLVRVRAFGLNRADLMQTRGQYAAPPGVPADIPGLEYAGEIEALGADALGPWRVGDRVFGIVGGGAYAEYLVTHPRMAVPVPANLDFEAAAGVPEVFLTAHDALETQARTKPGERVLVHAVGGGVGSAAVQLAHAMGCTVFGTSRTSEKLERARELGLDVTIDTSTEGFAAVVAKQTDGAGMHVILDHIGASALGQNLSALAVRGRMVVIGLLGGTSTTIDLSTLLRKRITIVGTALRSRPLEEKIAATQRFATQVIPWLERGRVRPLIDKVYPFEEIRAAHERMAANAGFGKIVLRV